MSQCPPPTPTRSRAAGALVEPLACVMHGLHRLAMPAGSELAVVGAGTIGLLIMQAASHDGAAWVGVIDPDPDRRALAATLGADHVSPDLAGLREVRELGVEFAVEATGVPAAPQAAYGSLGRGGALMIFGVAPEQAVFPLPQFQVYNDEITVLGSMAVLPSFEPALRTMASGAIDVDAMVTHTFPLEQFGHAVDAVRGRKGLKVQIG
jgi:NADPH2:quinone reductase